MEELVEVSGVANDESGESQAQKQAAEAQNERQEHQRPAQGLRIAHRYRVGCCCQQRQVGNRGCEAQLEQGLGPPEVARLANAQLHQPCYAMLHYLASASSFIEGRTGLQLARLLEQGFLRVELHRPPALTPRALGPQWARRTYVSGKDERPTSTLRGSQVMSRVCVRAGAGASLQVDLEVGLGKAPLVLDVRNFGDNGSTSLRKFRTRVASSIRAIANHFHDFTVRHCFASLDHLQRSIGIGSI